MQLRTVATAFYPFSAANSFKDKTLASHCPGIMKGPYYRYFVFSDIFEQHVQIYIGIG